MITEKDLYEAIAECQGERNPDARTCRNLAAFYTILDHIQEKKDTKSIDDGYSFEGPPTIEYKSNSDFSNAINDRDINEIMPILDELMDTLIIVNPRLYDSVMRKL